jgi:hypothetical protein
MDRQDRRRPDMSRQAAPGSPEDVYLSPPECGGQGNVQPEGGQEIAAYSPIYPRHRHVYLLMMVIEPAVTEAVGQVFEHEQSQVRVHDGQVSEELL